MSNKKITHYSLKAIKATKALFFLIFGKKSNGKSYAVKHEVLKDYLQNGIKFFYVRRWKDEITMSSVEQYFNDIDVQSLTNGKYNTIVCWRKKIYFANYNPETAKTVKGEQIGYYTALSQEQNVSSESFLDVGNIVFEEFMSRTMYIGKESEKLMFFYNTVDRNRKTTKLYLVGNTILRTNPYLVDWDLMDIIKTIKQGDIVKKEIEDTDGNKFLMSIEFCEGNKGGAALNLGKSASNISTGDWLSEPQPKLPDSYNNYKVVFRFVIERKSFRYLCEYLITPDKHFIWFIRPKYTKIKDKTLVISDIVSTNKLYFLTINDCIKSLKNPNLIKIFSTFNDSNIFYCSDLVGTEFKILKGGF